MKNELRLCSCLVGKENASMRYTFFKMYMARELPDWFVKSETDLPDSKWTEWLNELEDLATHLRLRTACVRYQHANFEHSVLDVHAAAQYFETEVICKSIRLQHEQALELLHVKYMHLFG